MQAPRRLTAVPPDLAPARAQMSRPNPVGGRGRDARAMRRAAGRVVVAEVPGRDDFLRFWMDLVARRCGRSEVISVVFGVTNQTGLNWLAGTACPTGDKVAIAFALWPEAFDALRADRGAA